MPKIIGHERQIDYLNKVIKNGRLSHAYLFYGPEHIGKLTLAKAFAKTFFCERGEKKLNSVCGECEPCRKIEGNKHPYVTLLSLHRTLVSKKESRKEIPIEDIRELKRTLSLTKSQDLWNIIIMDGVEKMSVEAANSFLKLLEEPGERTLFVLISPSREILLPTIISRAEPIRFSVVSENILRAALSGRKNADEFMRVAAGRPGVLLKLLQEKDYYEKENKFENLFNTSLMRGISNAFLFNERVAFDEELRRKTTDNLLKVLRFSLLGCASVPEGVSSLAEEIKFLYRMVSILDTTNVNPRLALDVLFLRCASNKYFKINHV